MCTGGEIVFGASSLLGAGATLIGGSQAASAQEAGTQAAIATEWAMYQQSRADFAPWREAGEAALGKLMGTPGTTLTAPKKPDISDPKYHETKLKNPHPIGSSAYSEWNVKHFVELMGQKDEFKEDLYNEDLTKWTIADAAYQNALETGVGGATQGLIAAGPGEFIPEEQPGYKFGYEEFVEKPLLAGASAAGDLRSTNTLKNLTRYASDYASTSYDNFLNRYYQSLNPYFSIAGMGQVGATGSANAALQTGANVANLQYQNALNQGQIATGMTAGIAGVAQQGVQNYLDYSILSKIFGQKPSAKDDPNYYYGWD